MPKSETRKSYAFDKSGNYRIRVKGFLDQSWSERLGGMYITKSDRGEQKSVATLVGLMRDQAELAGVLNTLYELHLTLLSVEYLDGDSYTDDRSQRAEVRGQRTEGEKLRRWEGEKKSAVRSCNTIYLLPLTFSLLPLTFCLLPLTFCLFST